MGDDRRTPPDDLSVREAVQQYIRRLRRDKAESTVRTCRLDLRQFVEWCEAEDVDEVGDLTGYDFELYETDRAAELAPTSLENQMGLLKRFISFCEDIGVVESGLHETVHVPYASPDEKSRDERLAVPDAKAQLQWFRDRSNGLYGSKWHALLEVTFHTGARLGGLRGLDLDDYDADFNVLEFRHRPTTGTPLKKKLNGERDVAILDDVADALDAYIADERFERHDEHGRAPLFTTRSEHGRMSPTAVRGWTYQATQPCHHTDDPCPHDKRRAECEWTRSSNASKCPSSRSPHAVRTGAITFHQNRGFDPKDTADRVNASIRTIKKHYDKAGRREEMEERRRHQIDKLELDSSEADTDE